MGNAYLFTLQPTFTQGLVLGQLSILFLLFVLLKYLFFDSSSEQPHKFVSYQPRIVREDSDDVDSIKKLSADPAAANGDASHNGEESADWLNIVMHQVGDKSQAQR